MQHGLLHKSQYETFVLFLREKVYFLQPFLFYYLNQIFADKLVSLSIGVSPFSIILRLIIN